MLIFFLKTYSFSMFSLRFVICLHNMLQGFFLIVSSNKPRSGNSQAVKRRHMGKHVGVSLGNRVHRHRSCDENAGLWIQGVYVHRSALESINAVWTENQV